MILGLNQFKDWYTTNEKEILRDFFAFLRFPSISTDKIYHTDVCKTAEWLNAYLTRIGMDSVIWETSGKPVVFATHLRAGPKKPTLLIYHHYDVQPVDPLELWKSPPFEPRIIENVVYARGASDNKGQCFYTITALKAFLELAKDAEINIKLLIEGEEESGGPGTYEVLANKREELKADHVLVVDAGLRSKEEPAVTVGVRGIMAMQLECMNAKIDLHSGLHGGIALNPNRVLVLALAQLFDEKGKIAIPGFYEDVLSFSEEDTAQLDMQFDHKSYQEKFGVEAYANEEGYSPIQSNLLRPTLEINGIGGGYVGEGFKTVIPSKAIAKLSCRLVPAQDPHKIYKQIVSFLEKKMPTGISLKAEYHHGAPAFRSTLQSPIVKIAANAYQEVWGKPCGYMLCGASIPIVGALAEATGGEIALIGVGLDEDDIHAPNEHFGMDQFKLGVLLMTNILMRHT
jgi:acetylornithine deacetylase/succinyl-diaminopimelate desuccinylase-like protein